MPRTVYAKLIYPALAADYAAGMTQAAIARKYNVAQGTVSKAIAATGTTKREYHKEPRDTAARDRDNAARAERDADIAARYRQGAKLRDLGDEYGLSHERVRQIANNSGVTSHEAWAGRKALPPPWLPEARRRREAGETIPAIAAALHVASYRVVRALKDAGMRSRHARFTNEPGQPWRCSICKRGEAEGAHFGPSKQHRSGLASKCDSCNAAQARAYYRKHADAVKAQRRARREIKRTDQAFLERERVRGREYYQRKKSDPAFMERERQRCRERYTRSTAKMVEASEE